MVEFLLQATLSNLLVGGLMALIAWFAHTKLRSASLANMIWSLVLIKLITPPLFLLPVLPLPGGLDFATNKHEPLPASSQELRTELDLASVSAFPREQASTSEFEPRNDRESASRLWFWGFLFWVTGSCSLFVLTTSRIWRFNRLLRLNGRDACELDRSWVTDIAVRLGLRETPAIQIIDANISPFVWSVLLSPVIVLPKSAVEALSPSDLRLVLAHEMAHIKRKDHWTRWLEWGAMISFWWNPAIWWVRTQLRRSEELACDELVLNCTQSQPQAYAKSLLNMAELLVTPVIRPPAVASPIVGGGDLEKRIKTMLAGKTTRIPLTTRLFIVALTLGMIPLGVVYAQDLEAIERRLGGAVEAGEISLEQASIMLEALRETVEEEHEHADDEEHEIHRYQRTWPTIGNKNMHEAIKTALAKANVKRELFEPIIEIVFKIADSFQEGESDISRETLGYLQDHLELNHDQVRTVLDFAKRWARHRRRADQHRDHGDHYYEHDAAHKRHHRTADGFGDSDRAKHDAENLEKMRQLELNLHRINKAVENKKLSKQEAEEKIELLKLKMRQHEHPSVKKTEQRERRDPEVFELKNIELGRWKMEQLRRDFRELDLELQRALETGDGEKKKKSKKALQQLQKLEEQMHALQLEEAELREKAEQQRLELAEVQLQALKHGEQNSNSNPHQLNADIIIDKNDPRFKAKQSYRDAKKKIEAALAKGEITKREAVEKLLHLRLKAKGQGKSAREKTHK